MMNIEISDVRGLDGRGIVLHLVWYENPFKISRREGDVFKTDGSATHWCWLHDGSPCPHEVWQAWEAYQVRNILAGKPAYACRFPAPDSGSNEQAK